MEYLILFSLSKQPSQTQRLSSGCSIIIDSNLIYILGTDCMVNNISKFSITFERSKENSLRWFCFHDLFLVIRKFL